MCEDSDSGHSWEDGAEVRLRIVLPPPSSLQPCSSILLPPGCSSFQLTKVAPLLPVQFPLAEILSLFQDPVHLLLIVPPGDLSPRLWVQSISLHHTP